MLPNVKGLVLLLSDKKIFKVLSIGVYEKTFDLSIKFLRSRLTEGYNFFFQTLLGPCPKCCILSLRAIGPLVPEKKIFQYLKGIVYQVAYICYLIFTIYGRCGHLGHVTQIR